MNNIKYKIRMFFLKLYYYKKCSCGHPINYHTCYEHGDGCIHGVCLAELYEDIVCCCQGFNDMWNKQYPPNKPELRLPQQDNVM